MTDKQTTICLSVSRLLDFFIAARLPAATKPIYVSVSNRSGHKELSSGGFHNYDFAKA
jgi:hypothetical protein